LFNDTLFSFSFISGSNVGNLLCFVTGLAMCGVTGSNFRFRYEMSSALGQVSVIMLSIYQVSTS